MARLRTWGWKVGLAVALIVVVAVGTTLFIRSRAPSPSPEAFCSQLAEAEGLETSFARLDVQAIERQVASLRAASQVAPDQVATQVRTVLALTVVVADAVAENPSDPASAVTQVLRDRRDQLPGVAAAGQVVEDYAASTCGIQLGS